MRIFISRHLAQNSIFQQLLSQKGHEVQGVSLLQFKPITVSAIPAADFIFFYSKNAVRFFLAQWVATSDTPHPRMACIGQGTAKALMNAGYTPAFIGEGQPQEVAQQFLPLCLHQRVLFPRAKQSKMSIQKALKQEDVQLLDIVVYDNSMRQDFSHPQADVLVFTSPMNVRAYFQQYPHQGETIISIGSSTSAALAQWDVPPPIQATQPSEAALAAAVLALDK